MYPALLSFHNIYIAASLHQVLMPDLYLKYQDLCLSQGSTVAVVLNQYFFVLNTDRQGDLLIMAANMNPALLVMNLYACSILKHTCTFDFQVVDLENPTIKHLMALAQ